MGFLYHFERHIIKNNKWSSAWVEVITMCNRTQRVPSGCLSIANCCCNGAEQRPHVSSGPSHFLVLIFPVGLRERRSRIEISRRSSLCSVRQLCTDLQKRKLRFCLSMRPLGPARLLLDNTHSEKFFFFLYSHVIIFTSSTASVILWLDVLILASSIELNPYWS